MAALVMGTVALSGVLIGPAPQPARAALIATGVNDSQSVKHDRVAVISAPGVLGNDLNLLGSASANLVSGVSHGTLNLRSDGGYTYMPAPGYLGIDTFRYRPSGLLSTAATVTITITNATAVARSDAYAGAANTPLGVAAPGVLANDTDADGDALVAEVVGGATGGSITLNQNGAILFTPAGGFSGIATFSYRVSDGLAWSAAANVSLTIVAPTPTPTPPVPTPVPTAPPTPSPTATPIVPVPTPSALLPNLPVPRATVPPSAVPQPSGSPPPTTDPGSSALQTTAVRPPPGEPTATDAPSSSAAAARPVNSGIDGGPPSPSGARAAPTGGADGGPGIQSVGFDERRLDLAGASIGLLASLDIWAVPAATIALPGLLVLVWVAIQAAGAIAWMPAVRRLRRGDDPRLRRRTAKSAL